MIQTILIRILLSPLALLYGIGVGLRNFFYQAGLLKSVSFSVPVISVGNLSVGGAGKTPHIEYLIRSLGEYVRVATMSRGYGRKSKGFRIVQRTDSAETVGDEPLQFKLKYPSVTVSVAESRSLGIPRLLGQDPEIQVILLDDAFQHRAVKPGVNIMLTEYLDPYFKDFLLPSGRLREWRSAAGRADVIIISKCPNVLEPSDRQWFLDRIKPAANQRVYFSRYDYGQAYFPFNPRYQLQLHDSLSVLLVCAIAKPQYLFQYLEERVGLVKMMDFDDHHYFTNYDMAQVKKNFDEMEGEQKVVITTEKDLSRLNLHRAYIQEQQIPLFSLPVRVVFHDQDGEAFDEYIRQFLLDFKV